MPIGNPPRDDSNPDSLYRSVPPLLEPPSDGAGLVLLRQCHCLMTPQRQNQVRKPIPNDEGEEGAGTQDHRALQCNAGGYGRNGAVWCICTALDMAWSERCSST